MQTQNDILTRDSITDNIVLIKVNKSYKPGLTPLELYDITRGCWKYRIEYVDIADYALTVYHGEVIEVYSIHKWFRAEDEHRKTIPYNPDKDRGRIIFRGELADSSIRDKYIRKSVKSLFKQGEAHSIKVITASISNHSPLDNSHSYEEKINHANQLDFDILKQIACDSSSISPPKKERKVTQIYRDPYISTYAKRRANGICQLCKIRAPFNSSDGTPYLESHHVVWLSAGGADSIDNIVALCPNCHKKMHIINDIKDVEYLKSIIK